MNLQDLVREIVAQTVSEKHLTAAEKKKKEDIVMAMKKTFKGPEPVMYAIATKKAEKLAEGDPEYDDMDISNLRSVAIKVKKATDEQLYDLWDFLKDSNWASSPNHAATKKLVRLELQKRGLKYRYNENELNKEDHEVSMAQSTLDSIIRSAMELKAKIGDQEIDIPAWIQDHITNSENYIDQANTGYYEGEGENENEEDESMYEARFKKGEDVGKPGKGFEKIAKSAAKQYGSKEAGAKVAGAILKKVVKEDEMEEANLSYGTDYDDPNDDYYGEKETYAKAEAIYDKGKELFNSGRTKEAEVLRQHALKLATGWDDRELPPYDLKESQELDEWTIRRMQHYAGIK